MPSEKPPNRYRTYRVAVYLMQLCFFGGRGWYVVIKGREAFVGRKIG